MDHRRKFIGLAALAAFLIGPAAFADPQGGGSGASQSAAGDALGAAAPLGPSDLNATTGGSNTVNSNNALNSNNDSYNTLNVGAVTEQTLGAATTGNSIGNIMCSSQCGGLAMSNGSVTVGTGAFSGFSGVGNFVMNTGNQNNVQGSLSVTIETPPAAH